jgi:hypothetical protein
MSTYQLLKGWIVTLTKKCCEKFPVGTWISSRSAKKAGKRVHAVIMSSGAEMLAENISFASESGRQIGLLRLKPSSVSSRMDHICDRWSIQNHPLNHQFDFSAMAHNLLQIVANRSKS